MLASSRINVSSLPDLLHTSKNSSPGRRTRQHRNMNSPGPSPVDIQHHLYSSFLEASTADVALHVRGSWEAIYRLHRVVLIQSVSVKLPVYRLAIQQVLIVQGFFRSLFTAGFAESSPRPTGHLRGTDEIDILFDDRNITRAGKRHNLFHRRTH
jgi:hypothetical protein